MLRPQLTAGRRTPSIVNKINRPNVLRLHAFFLITIIVINIVGTIGIDRLDHAIVPAVCSPVSGAHACPWLHGREASAFEILARLHGASAFGPLHRSRRAAHFFLRHVMCALGLRLAKNEYNNSGDGIGWLWVTAAWVP